MGKAFAYLVVIFLGLFILEWFGVIDIPYVDLPNFTTGKQELMHQTTEAIEQME